MTDDDVIVIQLNIQELRHSELNFFIIIFYVRPLSEGKVLKTKFDDIFAATRYGTCTCNYMFLMEYLLVA